MPGSKIVNQVTSRRTLAFVANGEFLPLLTARFGSIVLKKSASVFGSEKNASEIEVRTRAKDQGFRFYVAAYKNDVFTTQALPIWRVDFFNAIGR